MGGGHTAWHTPDHLCPALGSLPRQQFHLPRPNPNLSSSLSKSHSVNGHKFDIVINPNQSIHFEITADINLLPKKIYQLERALQLNGSCLPSKPKPAASGIIVTGDSDQFARVMGNIQKGEWGSAVDPPMVFDVPLFVILSPFRNIYTDLSGIKTE